MTRTYNSAFSTDIIALLDQKHALGYSYVTGECDLYYFDGFCSSYFPECKSLTKEIVLKWIERRPSEKSASVIKRTGPIRELARFIIRSGRIAYLLPPGILAKADQYIPYIFSESELSSFFYQSDIIKPVYKTPGHHLIMPVIFRLIYSCGLRPSEAVSLKCSDIDLASGRILIRESKGYKTRYVYLSDDMLLLCIKYSAEISKAFPNHCHFFPKSNELPYTTSWLTKIFKKCWYTCYPCSSTEHLPRVYDFRHTFASRRLYLWMKDEIDITHMLPYLSAYMGHTSIRETAYYLHLVPEFFKKGNMNEEHFSQLFPEVIE